MWDQYWEGNRQAEKKGKAANTKIGSRLEKQLDISYEAGII